MSMSWSLVAPLKEMSVEGNNLINLRIETKEQVKDKVADRHHVHVLLDVEHVDLVKVAMEPSSVLHSIRIQKTVNCS